MTARAVIREAVPGDFGAIRAIATAANQEFRAQMGGSLYEGYLANVLDVEPRARHGTLFVAELDGDVAGTITLYRDIEAEGIPVRLPAGTAGIRATAVRPSARGHGVGSTLVETAISRARNLGAEAIALHTAHCMTAAVRLYERHGFMRAPDYDYLANDYFASGEGARLDALAFVLGLTPTKR